MTFIIWHIEIRKVRFPSTEEQEKELGEYSFKSAAVFFDILPEDNRELANECTEKFNALAILTSYHKNETAGPDWLIAF